MRLENLKILENKIAELHEMMQDFDISNLTISRNDLFESVELVNVSIVNADEEQKFSYACESTNTIVNKENSTNEDVRMISEKEENIDETIALDNLYQINSIEQTEAIQIVETNNSIKCQIKDLPTVQEVFSLYPWANDEICNQII